MFEHVRRRYINQLTMRTCYDVPRDEGQDLSPVKEVVPKVSSLLCQGNVHHILKSEEKERRCND